MAGMLTNEMTNIQEILSKNGPINNSNHTTMTASKNKKSIISDNLDRSLNDDDFNNNNNSVVSNGQHEYYGENEDYNKIGTPIQDFYKDGSIFITGGTGFLGKVLINKLIRSCPDIETIYLLVRNKKGKDAYTRLDEIFDDPMFEKMKAEAPKFRHKIEIVHGDVSLPGLGLSSSDRQTLMDKVNIVIHGAATVRFDERLDLALAINVEGVHAILDLCKSMKNLKSLVHISTAYTNCYQKGPVKEEFYDYDITYEDVKKKISKMSQPEIEKSTRNILGPWPNTYTFTKALAEDYVKKNCKNLPIGMFRPAIVTSTYKEPVEGWIDNVYGPTGVVAGAGTGLLRTLHCDENLNANIVPVDYCVNAIIASAWDIANNCNERKEENMLIYNYVSTAENPITWKEFCYLNCTYGFDYPLGSAIWYYTLTLNRSYVWDRIYTIFYHLVPATLIDGVCLCIGQKPRMLKMYSKIQKFSDVISYFCTNEWEFFNNNVQSLWEKLPKKDKSLFPFTMKQVNWRNYLSVYLKGMGLYLFKEKMTHEEARRKWHRFYVYHMILKTVTLCSISYGLWTFIFRIFFNNTK